MSPIPLPPPTSSEHNRLIPIDLIRRRALERLYERRAAVQDLIRSLEDYQRSTKSRMAGCIELTAVRR